jgi:hypothetical protein
MKLILLAFLFSQANFANAMGYREKIKAGLKIARSSANRAYSNTGNSQIGAILGKLKNSKYQILTNDDPLCVGNVAARADCPGNTFYFCADTVNRYTDLLLSMTIMHEAAHAVGKCDECDAEALANEIFASEGKFNYQYGYKKCKP